MQWRFSSFFFYLRPDTSLFSKFAPKNQNCQFKLKFGTQTNSNVQNAIVIFTFPFSTGKILFLGKFGPEN